MIFWQFYIALFCHYLWIVLQSFTCSSEMDMSFLYSYRPVLYPVAVTTFDQQCADDIAEAADNPVLSLVSLCCQKIVQVRCEWNNICYWLSFIYTKAENSESEWHHLTFADIFDDFTWNMKFFSAIQILKPLQLDMIWYDMTHMISWNYNVLIAKSYGWLAFLLSLIDDQLKACSWLSLAVSSLQDASLTTAARDTVPQSLCEALLVSALQTDHDRSVEQLVAGWPWCRLVLRNYVPPMFGHQPPGSHHQCPSYGNTLEMCDHMRRGVKQTTCLAHTFIECLKQHTKTKLRFLDLTGYPSGGFTTVYVFLCSTSLVSHMINV